MRKANRLYLKRGLNERDVLIARLLEALEFCGSQIFFIEPDGNHYRATPTQFEEGYNGPVGFGDTIAESILVLCEEINGA